MMLRLVMVASMLVCWGWLTARARAQEPTPTELEEARHAFEVATQSFERGDYETAAEEFRAAYALSRHPDILYNVYLAEERAGRQAEAAEALAAHLEVAEISDEQRVLLTQRLERIRARAAAHETSEATSEGEPLRTEPIETALAEPETPGETPSDAPRASSPGSPPAVGIALLIAGGVLGLSFAGFAIASEVEDQRLAGGCGRDVGRYCVASETSTLEVLNLLADASWISGATLGVLGAILLAALPWSEDGAPRASVFFDGRSGGVTLRGAF